MLGQQVAHYKDSLGLSFTEIARQLNRPRSTCSSAYYRYKTQETQDGLHDAQAWREERGNEMAVSVIASEIHTLDELLSYCEVDRDVWTVSRYIVNKWPVGRRAEKKDLVWDEGVISGKAVDTGEIYQEALIQVKAWLVRREPVAIRPTVQPLEITTPLKWAIKPAPPTSGRALISSDWHIGFTKDYGTAKLTPFHDRQAISTFIDLASAVQPDRIDLLGDLIDLPEWTDKFARSPDFRQTTQPALIELHFWLHKLRQLFPNTPIYLYEGNHGARLRKMLMVHLPAAYDLRSVDRIDLPPTLSLPRLLALDSLGITWIAKYPSGCSYLGPIRLEHGDVVRQGPGDSVKALVMASSEPLIVGHTHRLEKVHRSLYVGNRFERTICAASSGCLCSLAPTGVPGHTQRQNWQQGAIIADFDKGSQAYDIHLTLIQDGITLWNGFSFKGDSKEPLGELKSLYPDWQF